MKRNSVLLTLAAACAGLLGLGAVLMSSASDEPLPPTAAPLPRDEQQSEQSQQSQSEPQPVPEDGQQSSQQSSEQSEQLAEQQSGGADSTAEAAQSEDDDAPQQSEAEPGRPVADAQVPTTRLIAALDLDRRPPPEPVAERRLHTVAAGDSLSSIARAYGVEVEQLVRANRLDRSAPLMVGDRLQVQPLRSYLPLQTPPGPAPYEGGGLIWGTVADTQTNAVHTAVVSFVDHRAGLPGAPDLLIACIHDQLVVELLWRASSPEPAPAAIRIYWRTDDGPMQTSRWRLDDGVLAAPDPQAFMSALHDVREFQLYVAAPDTLFISYWYPNLGAIVETPVQANLDHCGE